MSDLEVAPVEVTCGAEPPTVGSAEPPVVEVLLPRDVPLGGLRAMGVRRTLPQRARSLVGAWCFLDHYGPDLVSDTGGMAIPPHPHTCLQTASWLFEGEIEHRDSAGHHALVRPGELNLMTAGSGISHSERSTGETTVLHGVQLWVALPEAARRIDRTFEHYAPPAVDGVGWQARVFVGALLGSTSPVRTHTPLLGAELLLAPGVELALEVDAGFEHGVLLDSGEVQVDGQQLTSGQLGFRAPGAGVLVLRAADRPARVVLLGGPPFGEQIVMWWNFVGRSHEEIVSFREAWQAEVEAASAPPPAEARAVFGMPADDPEGPLPAPVMPHVRIRPRA